MKDQWTENYKTLRKEIEEDTKREKIFSAHGLGELTLLKWQYYPISLDFKPYYKAIVI